MPGAIFSRVKNWVAEKLTNEDLNAEIDNILDNFKPDQMDDYSVNVAQMQTTTDPGESGSESQATTLAGELERLRFTIGELKGTDYWYQTANSSIAELASALGGGLANNRIISGVSSANSSQPLFLVPNGATNTLTLDATPTAFQYSIEGTSYSIASDVTATGLVSAPTTNNTALVDDANAADGEETRWLGMYGSQIHYDTAGSEITSRDGQLAAFKLTTGAGTEYFIGRINDTDNVIEQCQRGYFFNNAGAGMPSIVFADNDTITLMKLTWVFATTASTMVVTYNEPRYASAAPSSPSTGDYWFDTAADKWKKFDSAQWIDADATLIGVCIQDENGNTVGARGFDFFKDYRALDMLTLKWHSNTEIRTDTLATSISIYGSRVRWTNDQIRWDITANLASGLTEASSTTYYLYLKEDGTPVMDTDPPLDLRGEINGWYHPHESWRYVGSCYNDGSSNLSSSAPNLISLYNTKETNIHTNDMAPVGTIIVWGGGSGTNPAGYSFCQGGSLSNFRYPKLFAILSTTFGSGTDTFTLPDLRGRVPIGAGTGSGLTNRALGTNYGTESHNHQWYQFNGDSATAEIYDSAGTENTVTADTRLGGVHIKTFSGGGETSILGEDAYTNKPTAASLQPSLGLNYLIKVV